MTNEPQPSRRILSGILRPKFSLRTLLVVMFVVALASAWWSQRGRVQQEVCRELTKRGISWELVKETPWYWPWLPERVLKLGDGHWFRHLASVSYAPQAQRDDDAAWIARLPQVDHLHLAWHGDPSAVETVRAQLAPLSQARGIDKIHLNEFSMAMNDPPLSLSTPLFDALPSMPHLRRLAITRAVISVDGARSLHRFPHLVGLDLSNVAIDPAGHRYIGQLNELEELDLANQFVGHEQLVHLRGLRRLKDLRLDKNALTDAGLADIAAITTLTKLSLGDNPITDIRSLSPLRRLKKLDLRDTQVTDAALASINTWPQLEELGLAGTPITPKVVPHLLAAKNLKRLDLEECDLDDAAVAPLLQSTTLETLNIEETKVSPAILAEINRSRLKQVNIDLLDFALHDLLKSDARLHVPATMGFEFRQGLGHFDPNLPGKQETSISFYRTAQLSGNLTPLRGNTVLKTLHLRGTDITDNDLKIIGTMPQLTALHLGDTEITDAGLAHLGGLVNLETLDLSQTKMTRDGFVHLAGMQKLAELRLDNLDLTVGKTDTWPALPGVTRLHISPSKLSADRPIPLSAFPNLETFEGQSLDVPGGAMSELNQLSKLKSLILGKVTNANILVKSLEGRPNLARLYFKADQLSAESFAVLRSLPALDFASLDLTDISPQQLQPLSGHPSLRVFECRDGSWNPDFLPIVASLPNLVRFCVGDVDIDQRHLALLRGQPLTWGTTIEWDRKLGPLPDRPDLFALPPGSNAVESLLLRGLSLTDRNLRDIAATTRVKSLRLSNCQLPATAGQQFASLYNLVELELDGVLITPQLLADLNKCSNLNKLDLSRTTITAELVSHLVGLNPLEELNLSNAIVSDADVAKLLTMPQLRELNLRGTQVTDAAFTGVAPTSRLHELDVRETSVTPQLVTILNGHPSLQWLRLSGLSFNQKECAHYLRSQPLTELENLNISSGLLAILPDGGLPKHPFVRDLTLTATSRVGDLLRLAEKHCPKAESFQLADENISAHDLEQLPRSARYVYFKNCRFSPDAFSKLPAVSVRHFRFIDCPPIVADFAGLSRLPCVQLVTFEKDTTATSEQVMQLTNCPRLRYLRLGGMQISDEVLLQLLAMPTIRSISAFSQGRSHLSPDVKQKIRQDGPWSKIE